MDNLGDLINQAIKDGNVTVNRVNPGNAIKAALAILAFHCLCLFLIVLKLYLF